MKAGVPGRRVLLLPERSRRRRRDRAADAAAACSSATSPRSARLPAIRASSCTAPATARSCSAPTRPATGASHLDLIAESIAENGGRSCVNASGVWTPAHGREIAEALAARLAADRAARRRRSGGRDRAVRRSARGRSGSRDQIDAGLARARRRGRHGAAIARARGSSKRDGSTYLLPTVIHCTVVVASARESRVPVSVRVGRRRRRRRDGGDAGLPRARRWSVTALTDDQALIDAAAGIGSDRPPEPRPDPDEHDRLGPAARGQSVRASLRARAFQLQRD